MSNSYLFWRSCIWAWNSNSRYFNFLRSCNISHPLNLIFSNSLLPEFLLLLKLILHWISIPRYFQNPITILLSCCTFVTIGRYPFLQKNYQLALIMDLPNDVHLLLLIVDFLHAWLFLYSLLLGKLLPFGQGFRFRNLPLAWEFVIWGW